VHVFLRARKSIGCVYKEPRILPNVQLVHKCMHIYAHIYEQDNLAEWVKASHGSAVKHTQPHYWLCRRLVQIVQYQGLTAMTVFHFFTSKRV
jgi:hypothetical protein